MKRPKKPKVCDCCFEHYELHWSKEEDMWICDECEDASREERSMNDYWEQEALEHMLDEEYGDLDAGV